MDKSRILIIDDDTNLRKSLADILRYKGFEPYAAESGTAGLTMLKEKHVNLVLVDLGLPDMAGIEVLKKIKTDYPSMEAIILTGNASIDTAIEATNRGAFSYLVKPYEIDQLILNIHRALEKQQAETALRESEERFRKIFEEGPLGVVLADMERRFVKVNRMMCQILGYTEQELTTLTFMDITHPDEQDASFQNSQKLYRGEVPFYKMEKRYLKKDGEIFWANLTVSMIRDKSGLPCFFLGMVEDINERRRAEKERERLIQELQEALAKVKTLSGLIPICAGCKKIRDDKGYWNQLEVYMTEHSDILFSHGLCPDCVGKAYSELEEMKRRR